MSLFLESTKSWDNLSGPLDTTDFMGANVASVQFKEVRIRYETYRIAQSLDSSAVTGDPENLPVIQIGPRALHNGRVEDKNAIWYSNTATAWQDFNVGDTIRVNGSGIGNDGAALILEIIDDDKGTQTLITDRTYTVQTLPINGYVANITPQTAMEFLFNLIENEEGLNFISKVDGETQRALVSGLDSTDLVTVTTMEFQGHKSYQFGTITVKGNDKGQGNPDLVDGVVQAFIITQELLVNPLMLFDEFDDIQNRIAPDERFLDGLSLKPVFGIKLSAEVNDPNDIAEIEEFEDLGNIGWFDENLNGGPNKFTFQNLVYKRADNTLNISIELTSSVTKIQFSVISTDSVFSAGNTKGIFGINFAPADEALYRNNTIANSKTQDFNFAFDNVLSVVGAASGVPRQDGTNLQNIKSMTMTFVSSSQIDVEVEMEMATDLVTRIAANATRKFMIYFETADHDKSRSETDKVQLLIDAQGYFTDATDDGMITMEQKYLIHPDSDIVADLQPFVDTFIEDDLVGVNNFFLDKNTRENDTIVFTGISNQIIIRKTTGASFVLDSFTANLSASEIIDDPTFGDVPNIDLTQSRGFKTPADDNRANVRLLRVFASDGGGLFFYRSQFPFIIRWEDFVALTGVNSEFFDNTEPNQGFNQDWVRYANTADWDLFFKTVLTAQKNGDPLTFSLETKIESANDYKAGDEWDTEEIKTFDENDVLLVDGAEKFIIKYDNGRVEANFTYIGPAPNPLLSELTGVMKLDVFEEGTFKNTYWFYSDYDASPNTWWKGIDSTNRVIITNPSGDIFRIEALIIGDLLPDKLEFKITARLYDNRPEAPAAGGKLMEDGTPKKLEGSTQFKFED